VYAELHGLAQGLMAGERLGHTLQPTALVNEAMARLLGRSVLEHVPDRAYLFAAASQTMRQVLVDHARRRKATKRGGNQQRIPLDDVVEAYERERLDLCAMDEALEVLATRSQRQSQVVVLRFFGGLTMPEIAENLGVSLGTVEKDWRVARAWLRGQLGGKADT
jgi:RNA polymerase sigma factor (TIGR02999 family)